MREIIFYETDSGGKPAEEFLASLEPAARAKVVRSLEMLRMSPIVPAKFGASSAVRSCGKCARNTRVTSIESWRPPRKEIGWFSCTAFKRNRKRRRGRIWKLLSRDRSGIFSDRDTCERRSPEIPRTEHGK